MNDAENRKALGRLIKAARRRRFKTVEDARLAAEVSRGTWDSAENGRSVKDFTLAAIEDALGWPDGYAQGILDGAEPVLPTGTPSRGSDSIGARLDALERRVASLERRGQVG